MDDLNRLYCVSCSVVSWLMCASLVLWRTQREKTVNKSSAPTIQNQFCKVHATKF